MIAIIALTSAIVFAVVARARDSANRPPCASNLRQLGTALEMYRSDYDGTEPIFLEDLVKAFPSVRTALVCPADHSQGANAFDTARNHFKVSIFYWRPYPTGYRDAIAAADPNHGVAYCVLHGKRLPDHGENDPRVNTTGVVLRLLTDSSIQTPHVGFHCGELPNGATLQMRTEWSLLTDAACTNKEFCDAAPIPCIDPRENN